MMRHTGGVASADISTKSSFASSAAARASSIETIPTCSPSAPIRRTSRAVMFSLMGAFGAVRLSCLISRLIIITPNLGDHAGKLQFLATLQTGQLACCRDFDHNEFVLQSFVSQLPYHRLPANKEP